MKDFLGTEIECGDTIVYAVSHSSSITLNLAEVTEVTTTKPRWNGDEPKPKLVVEWHGSSWPNGDSYRIKGEQVSLTQFKNLVVIRKATPESHPEWEACRNG